MDTDLDEAPRRGTLATAGWAVYPWASLLLHLACIAGMLACFAGFVLDLNPPLDVPGPLFWLGGFAVLVSVRILDMLLWRRILARRR